MAASAPKKRLALDTNVLFDLADGREIAHDFREVFQGNGYALVIAPTVVGELDFLENHGDAKQRLFAARSLDSLSRWGVDPFAIDSVREAIAQRFAAQLIQRRLLPDGEINDGLILAESSLAGIPLLVTSDKHLLDIDETALRLAFNDADLLPVSPVHPRRLLRALR